MNLGLQNITEIDVNMALSNYEIVHAKRYDDQTRFVRIHCVNEQGAILDLTDCLVAVKILTPKNELYVVDGKDVIIDAENQIFVRLSSSILGCAGKNKAEILISKQNSDENYEILTSMNFYIMIEENLTSDIQGGEKYDILNELIIKVKEIEKEVLGGALKPKGTILFEELPEIELTGITANQVGWMYNISNAFTSDDRFKDGGNIKYGRGNNVYCTLDGYWDVLTSSETIGGTILSEDEPDQIENGIWLRPYN